MDLFVISNVTLANNIENFTPSAGRTGASPTLHPGFMENPPFNPYAQLTGSFDVDASASSFDPVAEYRGDADRWERLLSRRLGLV